MLRKQYAIIISCHQSRHKFYVIVELHYYLPGIINTSGVETGGENWVRVTIVLFWSESRHPCFCIFIYVCCVFLATGWLRCVWLRSGWKHVNHVVCLFFIFYYWLVLVCMCVLCSCVWWCCYGCAWIEGTCSRGRFCVLLFVVIWYWLVPLFFPLMSEKGCKSYL